MKNIILISTLFFFLGCDNSKKETPEIKNSTDLIALQKEESSNKTITLASTVQEYSCWGSMSTVMDDIFTSYIARDRNNCNIGKAKIILEKVVGRKGDGEAIFKVIDRIDVEKENENITFFKITLDINDDTKNQDYVVKFYDERKEIITKTYALWKIDYETMAFKKIDVPKNLTFGNPDWME